MARVPINPGAIDWSGENPGMYLKDRADGPFVSLISYFRVVHSPHGKGHAAFMLLDPYGDGRSAGRPNVCLTDNEPLAEYLKKGFVSFFGAFKGATGLGNLQVKPAWDFMAGGDGRSVHTEWFRSAIGQVHLSWNQLGAPFLVEFDKEHSATGKHEDVWITIDTERQEVIEEYEEAEHACKSPTYVADTIRLAGFTEVELRRMDGAAFTGGPEPYWLWLVAKK
jgi:hypothetical protein